MSRKPSLLTNAQREYLNGEKEYPPSTESDVRRRIRERVRNAILDFSILFHQLEPQDRELIFDGPQAAPRSVLSEAQPAESIIDAVAFLAEAHNDVEQFEKTIGQALVKVADKEGGYRRYIVNIEEQLPEDLPELSDEELAEIDSAVFSQLFFRGEIDEAELLELTKRRKRGWEKKRERLVEDAKTHAVEEYLEQLEEGDSDE